MRWARKMRLRARSLFRKDQMNAELSEELQFHLESEAAKNEAAGMSKEEAQRAALSEFGVRNAMLTQFLPKVSRRWPSRPCDLRFLQFCAGNRQDSARHVVALIAKTGIRVWIVVE